MNIKIPISKYCGWPRHAIRDVSVRLRDNGSRIPNDLPLADLLTLTLGNAYSCDNPALLS